MDGSKLLATTTHLAADMVESFSWSDIWQRPIENGAAYEWTMIAALVNVARDSGYSCTYPLGSYPELKDLFVLRNEVPFQHAAQPGHSLDVTKYPLYMIFLASLIPKVEFRKQERIYSIFTEGYPYHKLMSSKKYSVRPDIVIVEGNIAEGFPVANEDKSFINFNFSLGNKEMVEGKLRVIKSSLLPLTSRIPVEGCELPVLTLIETSVNKSYKKAAQQLAEYASVFTTKPWSPNLFLVSGNNVQGPDLDSYFTDLTQSDIADSFARVARDIFSRSGLI